MKKFIAMMLCIVLVLSLVACGKDAEEPTETTTEPTTETTEAPTTEEVTEEITEDVTDEFVEDEFMELPDFRFIERAEDGTEIDIEPTETMLLLQSLYDGYPQDQRPSPLIVRVVSATEYATNYLPTDIEGLEVVAAEPVISAIAHFTSIITVPEGTDPQTVVDYINNNIDPDLRSKWMSSAAETYKLIVSGNTILFIMTDMTFAEHCVNAFNAKMAG